LYRNDTDREHGRQGLLRFCAIAAGRAEASVVHADDDVMAILDPSPATRW